MTRPDLAFGSLDICTSQKHSKVEDIIKADKLLKLAKEERLKLTFPKLTSLEDIKLIVYQDARFGNVSDEESHGGFIIFYVTRMVHVVLYPGLRRESSEW